MNETPNDFGVLEEALIAAGREIRYPATPNVAARVAEHLSRDGNRPQSLQFARAHWLRFAVSAAAAFILAVLLLLLIPDARETLGQLLGLRGLRILYPTPTAVPSPTRGAATGEMTIHPTPRASATPTRVPYALCCEISLAEAEERVGFELKTPQHRTPSTVYYQRIFDSGEQVVMVFGDRDDPEFVLYQAHRWIYGKMVGGAMGGGVVLEEATVGGERALWISGAPHVVLRLDTRGKPIYETARAVNMNTLAWETGDEDTGVIYRLETKKTLSEAVQFAETLR